ncbi:helix-turn-helix domain-containing protein [Candidatus Poriferisodalis sp.]|uniref:AlbA family DNA-binding domain-containing protein n=1 Tax=Candidatus Poriferisodalis sp. TaxID=3101277 RepID=UPI003B02AD82
MSHQLDPERLARQVRWHALPVEWEQLDYATFLERRRDLIAQVVRDGFERLWDDKAVPEPSSTLADLLAVGESQTVEYKSTARWNKHAGKADKKMEHVIAKSVCGFLNAEGGTLLIGVDDEANVLGLDDYMQTLGGRANCDGYELVLRQLLDDRLSIQTVGVVRISFDQFADVDVCLVSVAASGKPVFSKPHEGGQLHTEFWVRIGNATKQLHGDDLLDYQSDHWG